MAKQSFAAGVVDRYVEALFDTAQKSGIEAEVAEQISLIRYSIISLKNHKRYLKRISFFPAEAEKFIGFLQENLDLCNEIDNFLHLLVTNGRIGMIVDICDAYAAHLDKVSGKKTVYLTLPNQRSESEVDDIMSKVKSVFGDKVDCVSDIDPTLMEGFTLQYQSKVLDYSLASKLRRLQSAIRREGYEN